MIDTKKILYIKLTDRCNLKCSHCYAGCTIYGQDMSPEVVDKILELYPKEPTEVIFHGGEPLLCLKTLERLVDHFLHNPNCRLNITTNLCYKISNEILDILKRIHYVSTSWDTKVRFKEEGQQELWMNNCEFLVDNGIDLQINTVLTKDLVAKQELRPSLALRFLSSIPHKSLHFERLSLTGRGSAVDIPTWDEVDDWLYRCYLENKENFHENITIFTQYKALINGDLTGCFARNCSMKTRTINPDGTIATCPNYYNHIIATVFDQTPTNTLGIIEAMERKKNPKCFLCNLYKYCNGDCFQQYWQGDRCAFPKKLFNLLLKEWEQEHAQQK